MQMKDINMTVCRFSAVSMFVKGTERWRRTEDVSHSGLRPTRSALRAPRVDNIQFQMANPPFQRRP